MAEIRKVVPSAGVSNFQQVAADGGGAFKVLADGLNEAYEFLKPKAIEQRIEHNADIERQIARQQIGDPAGNITVSSSGGGAGVPTNAGWVVDGLVARGMAQHHAEGFAINFKDESDFNTGAVGDNGNAYGLAQWNGPRKRGLEAFAGARGKPARDGDVQLDFLMHELGSNEAGAWAKIQNTGDRGSAAAAILNYFERPAEVHRARREAEYLGGNVSLSTSGAPASAPYQPPTMIRDADGKLQARLLSPMGGEVVQASNAVAGVAYQSEMMLKGLGDLMSISEQFPLNPQGYQQAAQGYVDEIVSKAPEMFRSDLRVSMEREARQRVLGMMEEQHRDTRQRANNSNSALMDKWSDNLSSAIAGGNPDDIAAAQSELDGVLAVREALPGVSWTPEQSDNVRIKTAEAGQAAIAKRSSDQNKAYKDAADSTVSAANLGLYAADETSWDNPQFAAAYPDDYRKAKAAQLRREAMPGFTAAPAADRKAAIAEIEAIPINDEQDAATVKAFRDADQSVTKAFDESPMDAANAYLPQKPPPMPDLAGDPKGIVAALQARADYARGLKANGHSKYTAFLTDGEAEALGTVLGKDTPPDIKTAVVGMLVQGFGEDAAKVLSEAKSNDPVTLFSGMLIARGGDGSVAQSAMRGQAMLDEGLVQAPSKANSVAAISTDIAGALALVPEALRAEGDILKFATAIYANEARGIDPTPKAAQALMAQSVNKALGQSTNRRGQVTGGVQDVGGQSVLLPVGVAGEDMNGALDAAFGGQVSGFWSRLTSVGRVSDQTPATPDAWAAAGISSSKGSMPMMGGKPLDAKHYQNGNIRIVPLPRSGSKAYRMEYVSGSGAVQDVLDASGNIYQFDVGALIDATAP